MSSVAESEGVSESNVIMFIGDRTIQPHDSPQSIGITVADIIGLFLVFSLLSASLFVSFNKLKMKHVMGLAVLSGNVIRRMNEVNLC